jgi:hypothetical protein
MVPWFYFFFLTYLINSPWNISTRVEKGTTNGISLSMVTVLSSLMVNGGPSSVEIKHTLSDSN